MTTVPLQTSLADIARKAVQLAEDVKNDPRRFAIYKGRELDFVSDVFGIGAYSYDDPDTPGLTEDQLRLFNSAFTHRRTTCKSGHGCGKSFCLALIVLTWLYVWEGVVVTTASTWDQVRLVLWREIGSLFRKSKVTLPAVDGHPLQTELHVEREWIAFGRSTDDENAFVGVHHPRLLCVVDEASGVPDNIHLAVSALCTGKDNHVVEVGNPILNSGEFYEHHRMTTWHPLHMSCLSHPNVVLGREVIPGAVSQWWIDEMAERWGKTSPMFMARVIGEFPTEGSWQLYPLAWVDAAMRTPEFDDAGFPGIMAVDVARGGDNKTVVAYRQGRNIQIIGAWGREDTMSTTGQVIQLFEQYKPQVIVVDEVGLGGGVLDRLLEQGFPAWGFISQASASDKFHFMRRRDEFSWRFRKALEARQVSLTELPILRKHMTSIQYKIESTGKIKAQSKDEMLEEGKESPDYADATMMTYVTDTEVPLEAPPKRGADMDPNVFVLEPHDGNTERWDTGIAELGYGY